MDEQAQAKKLRAERLLSKVEASMVPASPDDDQETITEEERTMFRKVGLRMKQYLPLGIFSSLSLSLAQILGNQYSSLNYVGIFI